jgi:hypothetical protein
VPIVKGFFGQETTDADFYWVIWVGNYWCGFYRILWEGNYWCRFLQDSLGRKPQVPIFAGFFGQETTGSDFSQDSLDRKPQVPIFTGFFG